MVFLFRRKAIHREPRAGSSSGDHLPTMKAGVKGTDERFHRHTARFIADSKKGSCPFVAPGSIDVRFIARQGRDVHEKCHSFAATSTREKPSM